MPLSPGPVPAADPYMLGWCIKIQGPAGELSIFPVQGEVPETIQRVEKLLHAPFCVPFKDLKPRFCSVLALVSKCFDSVLGSRPVGHRLFQQPRTFLEYIHKKGRHGHPGVVPSNFHARYQPPARLSAPGTLGRPIATTVLPGSSVNRPSADALGLAAWHHTLSWWKRLTRSAAGGMRDGKEEEHALLLA